MWRSGHCRTWSPSPRPATACWWPTKASRRADHSLPANGLDISDKDGAVNITTAPVRGLYMPDRIASLTTGVAASADVTLAVLVDQQFGQCGTSARTA